MERVFDICHGCRRCFSLCNSFPLLSAAVDESDTGEVDGVAREVSWQVVDHCYLCDMCYMWTVRTGTLAVNIHPWGVSPFPHAKIAGARALLPGIAGPA